MKDIYVYTGKGAYQAKDVENFLAVFDYDYIRLSEYDLNELKTAGILIVPGGQTDAFLPAWGPTGIKKIRDFVISGGTYIGICAGAYVAGESYKESPGLEFFPGELKYVKSQSIIDVKDANQIKYKLICENCPSLANVKKGETIITDNKNQPQAIKFKMSKGLVILFASHPEGSVFYDQPPQTFPGAKYFDLLLKSLLKT